MPRASSGNYLVDRAYHFARTKPFPPVAEPVSEKVKTSARGGNVADKDKWLKSLEAEDYEKGLLKELIEELEKEIGLGKKLLPTDRELVVAAFTMARGAWRMAKTPYQGPRKSSNTTNAAGASSSSSSPPSSASPSPFSAKSATGRPVLKYGSIGRFSSEMKHDTATQYDFTQEVTALMKQTTPKGQPFEVAMEWKVGCGSAGHYRGKDGLPRHKFLESIRRTFETCDAVYAVGRAGFACDKATMVDFLEGLFCWFYYGYDDEDGNPTYHKYWAPDIVAMCRGDMTPVGRLIDDMEAGHAQRLFEGLANLALAGLPVQRYTFLRGLGEDAVWIEAAGSTATAATTITTTTVSTPYGGGNESWVKPFEYAGSEIKPRIIKKHLFFDVALMDAALPAKESSISIQSSTEGSQPSSKSVESGKVSQGTKALESKAAAVSSKDTEKGKQPKSSKSAESSDIKKTEKKLTEDGDPALTKKRNLVDESKPASSSKKLQPLNTSTPTQSTLSAGTSSKTSEGSKAKAVATSSSVSGTGAKGQGSGKRAAEEPEVSTSGSKKQKGTFRRKKRDWCCLCLDRCVDAAKRGDRDPRRPGESWKAWCRRHYLEHHAGHKTCPADAWEECGEGQKFADVVDKHDPEAIDYHLEHHHSSEKG